MHSLLYKRHTRDILTADLASAGTYLAGTSRCKIRRRDHRLIRMLRDIEGKSQAEGQLSGVWSYREFIRRTIGTDSENLLVHVISKNKHPYAVRVAVWMLGRTCMTFGAKAIARRMRDSDVRIRREVARALRRMCGWAELRAMEHDEDERVQRLATPRVQSDLADRMPKFLRTATPGIEDRGPQSMVVSNSLQLGDYSPKTVHHIRRILETIRKFVRRSLRSTQP